MSVMPCTSAWRRRLRPWGSRRGPWPGRRRRSRRRRRSAPGRPARRCGTKSRASRRPRARGELAVGEGAGAAPAAGDVARRAVGADAGVARRARAPVDVGACSSSRTELSLRAHQLQRGEDAGGAGPGDDAVVVWLVGSSVGGGGGRKRKIPFGDTKALRGSISNCAAGQRPALAEGRTSHASARPVGPGPAAAPTVGTRPRLQEEPMDDPSLRVRAPRATRPAG